MTYFSFVPDDALELRDVPSADAPWSEVFKFAYQGEAYERYGVQRSREQIFAAHEAAWQRYQLDASLPQTLESLRTVLFVWQRKTHRREQEPGAEVDGKYTCRHRSTGSLTEPGAKLQHEHVVPRKVLITELFARPADHVSTLRQALACVVTKAEHDRRDRRAPLLIFSRTVCVWRRLPSLNAHRHWPTVSGGAARTRRRRPRRRRRWRA